MPMGRLLLFVGLSIAATGLLMMFGEQLGIGQLPGDLTIKGDKYAVHIPLVTCLVISAILSVVLWVIRRFL